jgi:hypothetical protein
MNPKKLSSHDMVTEIFSLSWWNNGFHEPLRPPHDSVFQILKRRGKDFLDHIRGSDLRASPTRLKPDFVTDNDDGAFGDGADAALPVSRLLKSI